MEKISDARTIADAAAIRYDLLKAGYSPGAARILSRREAEQMHFERQAVAYRDAISL